MFKDIKKISETPLEFLNRMRLEKPDIKDQKLSYAGRLDPMAEGEMLVLVGEENKEYKKYLGFDKEYVATFLIDTKTDTGDALGLILNPPMLRFGEVSPPPLHYGEVNEKKIEEEVENLKNIKKQKYPWFSAKTILGLKLFDHFKAGNFLIERPEREVSIKEVTLLKIQTENKSDIEKYLISAIKNVHGDFRQKEILENWQNYFKNSTLSNLQTFQIKIRVSSGTYIRALTENFSFPVILLKLNRTKIFIDS